MGGQLQTDATDRERIMLGLLESVARDGAQSQRRIATELGIALGLVNAYLKRCVKKGLVKVSEAPTRRYAYYLTPQGFAEKSRLTVEYLSYSFTFFRRAKADCALVFETALQKGYRPLVLDGRSDLAEIAAICALEFGIPIAALIDAGSAGSEFLGIPVVRSLEDVGGPYDAVVVTDLLATKDRRDAAVALMGADRVFVPNLLAVQLQEIEGAAT